MIWVDSQPKGQTLKSWVTYHKSERKKKQVATLNIFSVVKIGKGCRFNGWVLIDIIVSLKEIKIDVSTETTMPIDTRVSIEKQSCDVTNQQKC